MVSFTPEGGPQTMERRASVGASDATAMKRDSATSAKSESNSFSSSNGDGFAKRVGPIDSSPVADPPVKRVKLSETLSRPASDAQLASTLFKKFVNSALDEKAMGNYRAYTELRRKFIAHPLDSDAPSSLELRQTISALTHTVSRLDKGCTQLVGDIVNMTWAGRDTLFFKAYLRLLGNLVSAHSNYIPMVTKMLVHHLSLTSSRMCTLPNHQPVTRQVIYDRTHEALEYIMDLVPTAAHSTLFPVLVSEFPNKSEKRLAQTTYLQNLLQVIEYAPELRSKVLAMVVERVIKIDIEIQADIEDLQGEEGDSLARELNHGAEDDDESDTSDDSEDDYEDEMKQNSVEKIKETVDKLDSLLEILFEFFSRYFPAGISSDEKNINADTRVIFEHLLESFDKTILPTYQSRYTQFVIFWAVQKSPKFIDVFLGELIGCATDNNKSQVLRQAAAAYVASFVGRAKMMDKISVRTVVSLLCNWLNAFLVRREIDCSGPDIGKFGSFYSVFQAIMYIFCFRWRDLKIGEEENGEESAPGGTGERWIPGLLVMQRAIFSKFNPLKVCSQIVVGEFAKISNFLNFLYCYSIIEANQRSILGGGAPNDSSSSNANGGTSGGARYTDRTALEAYFPFDPYNLKRSKKWVKGYYVAWQPVPGLDPEESDDEDDDGDEEEEDDDDDEADEEQECEGEEDEGDLESDEDESEGE